MKDIKTWATIGGRIEDYVWAYKILGAAAARKRIEDAYGDSADLVYAGLRVYMKSGSDVYYGGSN